MSQCDDALDRYLDHLCAGVPSQEAMDGVNTPLAATARQLFGKPRPEPHPAFLTRLEANLVISAQSVPALQPDTATTAITSLTGVRSATRVPDWDRHRAHPRLRLAALAAVLVIVLGAVVTSVIGSNRGADRLFFLPAATSAAPPPAAVDCAAYLETWNRAQTEISRRYDRLLFAQIPAIVRPSPINPNQWISIIPASALPRGSEPNGATRSAIVGAVRREYACIGTWIPSLAALPPVPTAQADPSTPVPTGSSSPVTPPAVVTITSLPDGRVGALVGDNFPASGVATYFIFAPAENDWILTEVAAVATDAYITAHPGAPLTDKVTIYVNDVRVISVPARFDLAASTPIDIVVVNDGMRERQFSIPSAGIDLTIAPGEQRTVTVTLPAGGHRYTVDVNSNDDLESGGWLWAFAGAARPIPTVSPELR